MPWFVCFTVPPNTAHGFWRDRVGLSCTDKPDDAAIEQIRAALEAKGYKNLTLFDVCQYQENEQ